ncbi:MAG: branched-chain amino acid ABC transporter permease, partial [Candidatus Thorarchaeota archaeon]
MAKSDVKKFFVYTVFLGILILPMVGFPTATFHAARAFGVWGVFVGILAIALMVKTLRGTSGYVKFASTVSSLSGGGSSKIKSFNRKYSFSVLALAVMIFPLLANNYMIDVGITCLIYVVLGLGLNIVVGLAGLLDLGYIAFYAVGAYTYSLLNLHFGLSFWACLPIGVGLGAVLGCIIGYPTLKMRGDYLAIVTMGFGEIIRLVLNNWDKLTHGPNGLLGMQKPMLYYPSFGDGGLTWAVFKLKSLPVLYYLIFIIAVLTIIAVNRLDKSRIGRAWVAIREDEVAAELSGVPTTWLKLLAYAMG